MTTELEQEFFKVFGIEKIECCKHFKYFDSKCDRLDSTEKCLDCIGTNKVYPKITDRILLKLIFWLIQYEETFEDSRFENIEEFKKYVIAKCISIKTTNDKWLAKQIQQLFKEGE